MRTKCITSLFIPMVMLASVSAEDAGTDIAAGDRHPQVDMVYPENAFYHAGKGGRIIDVTKPPFYAKGDGISDDSGALIAAINFVFMSHEPASWRRNRSKGSYSLYFPNGTYRVTRSVRQSLPVRVGSLPFGRTIQYWVMDESEFKDTGRFQFPEGNNERNDSLIIIGQSREKTIIRLDDNCPGFEVGANQPVLAYYRFKCGSNNNMDNYLENITIDTGNGNPGAVGVKWNAANTGAIRNTTISSGDGQGMAGILADAGSVQGLFEDVSVTGFDKGVVVPFTPLWMKMVVMDHVTLSGQKEQGIYFGKGSLTAHKVLIKDVPVALTLENRSQAVILNSEFRCNDAGKAAIHTINSHLYIRGLKTEGSQTAIVSDGQRKTENSEIDEYVSSAVVSSGGRKESTQFKGLPIKDTPPLLRAMNVNDWANVDDFGAVGDGITDDTLAIQRAMDSGKPAIIFPRAVYVINGTVRIPKSVRRMTFHFATTIRTVQSDPAMFCVGGEPSSEALLIEQNINAGGLFLDHEADRPVVIADSTTHYAFCFTKQTQHLNKNMLPWDYVTHDLLSNCWRMYRNASPQGTPKKLFVNNVFGFAPGGPNARYAVENVHVWCRYVNTEHYKVEMSFRKSDVWVLGFKSEINSTYFHAEDGTRLEVLGGVIYETGKPHGPLPIVVSRNSDVRITMEVRGRCEPDDVFLSDLRGDQETLIRYKDISTAPLVPLVVN